MHRRFPPHDVHSALLKPIQVRILQLQVIGNMDFRHNQVDLDKSKTASVKMHEISLRDSKFQMGHDWMVPRTSCRDSLEGLAKTAGSRPDDLCEPDPAIFPAGMRMGRESYSRHE